MAEPRYVISMGSCANAGGPFYDSYSVVKGSGHYYTGKIFTFRVCPPRPEALINGILELRKKMKAEVNAPKTKVKELSTGWKII